jgi:N-acetylglutamate synthase-like GNAT family acetyltransferase
MIRKFSYKDYTLIIELTPMYIIQKICLYKNDKLEECINDFFIISEENVLKFKKILKNFDFKTQERIKKLIKKFMD